MLISLDYKKITLIEKTDKNSEVSIEIKTLDTLSFNKLVKVIPDVLSDDNQIKILSEMSDEKLLNIASEVFPKFCKNFKGVEVEENGSIRDANIEDLYTISSLVTLTTKVLFELISISTVKKNKVENNELGKQ